MRRIFLCVILLLASGGGVARAEPSADDLFEEGKRAFRVGDYDEAIHKWKDGYHIRGDAVFLFNMAQAYRAKKDYERAIFFYESYLKDAKDATNRDKVQERVAEMKALLEEQRHQEKAPPSGPLAPVVQPPPSTPIVIDTPPSPRPGGRSFKVAGLATGGVGVALLGAGVYFALSASSLRSDVAAAPAWTQEIADKDAEGRRDSTLSLVGLGVGAAALITGGTLYFLGAKRDRELHVAPMPTKGGAGVALGFSF